MAPFNEESVQEVVTAEGQEVELTPEQKKEKLAQLMADGKRELRASNYEVASEKFGEAAEFATKTYGEFDAEAFEPNFMYGRALVELSAIESDLFQNALLNMKKDNGTAETAEDQDANESMTEEERDEVREMVTDALIENAEELEKKNEGTEEKKEEAAVEEKEEEKAVEEKKEDEKAVEEKKEEEKAVEEKKEEEKAVEEKEEEKSDEEDKTEKAKGDDNKGSAEESVTAEKKEETDEKMAEGTENEDGTEAEGEEEGEDAEKEDIEDGDEEDEDEELDNSQLAYESLEVARTIADRMIEQTSSDEWKRKKADVFVQLAQCQINEEKYKEALEDLASARELLATIESSKGDRLNSEIWFHEGRINRLRSEFGLAAEAFVKAATEMETTLEGVRSASGDAPTDDQKEEMEDLENIIKDFKDRAEDCRGSEESKKKVAEMEEKEKKPAILSSSNANSDSTANDISSLVRKKRAHDESEVEGVPKKAKSEEVEDKGEENIAV